MAGVRVLLLTAVLLGAAAGRRLICWQALLQCQGEPDCKYAYGLYSEACEPVLLQHADLAGASPPRGRRCPSHCISALIQLNQTRHGPALEDCDCAKDESCRATKLAIEPCMPRTGASGASVLGCTEARRRCERDARCGAALGRYLAHCGKLFNGVRCAHECLAVIQEMLTLPKAMLLSECVCDGLERPICEAVKENMARLCFGEDTGTYQGGGSSGGSSPDDDYYDNYDEDLPTRVELEEARTVQDTGSSGDPSIAAPSLLLAAWTLATSILFSLL
ncbi:hypothetical protein NDU88_002487 [Pleurodeles waltl]|uniref:GDNF/GAS1 domain-containing protein n=1 Tax=Pleurodeles waltl TaxID=8319 RepID=A0AAV7VZH5_PLEWA|nr:hypothetical protein NDU88_002487 [Pleurodeles waltl]